jgi:hypothetical protein
MPSCTNKQRTQDQVLIQQILFYITSLYSHLAYGKGLLAIVVIQRLVMFGDVVQMLFAASCTVFSDTTRLQSVQTTQKNEARQMRPM